MPHSLGRLATSRTVGGAVARFTLTGLLLIVLVGVGGVAVLRHIGRNEALHDAQRVTALEGRGFVAPEVTPGVQAGDPAALRRFTRRVGDRLVRSPVVRVKLWAPDGRIVWSDEPRLVGQRYELGAPERRALRTGRTDADISDLTEPENRFERGQGKLVEVYLGIRTPEGQRLLYETYQRDASLASGGQRLLRAFLPVLLGVLALVALLQVPLAYSLARRVQRSETGRLDALERSLAAQDAERRRIASDLHDSVVQTLAGTSYRLGAAEARIGEDTPPALAEAVRESARDTRRTIGELRSLLVDIYPPSLEREGLVAALGDLMTKTGNQQLATHLDAPAHLDLPVRTEALVFRAAQEALRNVVTHAGAHNVTVSVHRENGSVKLAVRDDGRGFEPGQRGVTRADGGHFGLRALDDLVRDADGRLVVESEPGKGTLVSMEVPVP
jgi:signal transduction histidine kinase